MIRVIFKECWKVFTILIILVGLLICIPKMQLDTSEKTVDSIILEEESYHSDVAYASVLEEPTEQQPEPVPEHTSKYQISYVTDEFDEHLTQVMKDFGVNLDIAYVYATIFCESTFRTTIESASGAIGYMQVLPSTRDYIYFKIKPEYPQYSGLSKDLSDPYTNVVYGLYYFKHIAESFGESEVNENNLSKILTCYNRGVGGGQKYFKHTGHWDSDYAKKIVRVAEQIKTNGGL